MSFRINDAGDGLVLTEDPARVLPLAKDVLEQTKQVKERAVNETTNIKNTAIEELTAIKDAAVNETTEIKDEAVAAKNTAVELRLLRQKMLLITFKHYLMKKWLPQKTQKCSCFFC